jgi:hypothetical protein
MVKIKGMLRMKFYVILSIRALLYAIFLATIMIISEVVFVFATKLIDHQLPFTSFFSVGFFAVSTGFVPFMPSPSRLSSVPLGLGARVLLVIEYTAFVAVAILASSKFMLYEHIVIPNSAAQCMSAYVVITVISLISNFSKLKREIMRSRGISGDTTLTSK